jgi:hypothetical protein
MAIGHATIASAQQPRVKEPGSEGKTVIPKAVLDKLDEHLDVTFAKYGDRTLQLDIFRPKNASEELPAIVCIHGGGWRYAASANAKVGFTPMWHACSGNSFAQWGWRLEPSIQ